MDRKLRPGSFLCWSDVEKCEKLSHPQKFFQCGRKILALLCWCSAWGLSEKLSAHESKTLAAPSLVSLQKKNYSSLIYQTIDLSGICSIFFKAVLDKNLILWTCSFLAPKWFYDILAAHIGSKLILIHWGKLPLQRILRWLLNWSLTHTQHTNTMVLLGFLNYINVCISKSYQNQPIEY